MGDAVAGHLVAYNTHFGEELTTADLDGKWLWDVVATDRHAVLESHLRSGDFFEGLAVMPEAQRVLRRLEMNYEVFIGPAAVGVPTSFNQKYRWLGENFPFFSGLPIFYLGDKGVFRAGYLFQEKPRQFRG